MMAYPTTSNVIIFFGLIDPNPLPFFLVALYSAGVCSWILLFFLKRPKYKSGK